MGLPLGAGSEFMAARTSTLAFDGKVSFNLRITDLGFGDRGYNFEASQFTAPEDGNYFFCYSAGVS